MEAKERPILFSDQMVRAILDGRKTQTRRVIKPQPDFKNKEMRLGSGDPGSIWNRCPYGAPGDRLWVRECCRLYSMSGYEPTNPEKAEVRYRADQKIVQFNVSHGVVHKGPLKFHRWSPSIHMPRWASRITLQVKDIRAERIQDISTEDILAEGITTHLVEHDFEADLFGQFMELWNSINEQRGFSWDANPWVWVVDFEVLDA